ncbi:MAG: hypothetical protein HC805_08405 [Alkalinema sp. RL_2_19]|nr:hypothetical protein [Alkalinema sp. RL_2_19]
MSWVMALLQVPYLIYVMTAQLADYLVVWAGKQSHRIWEILPWVAVYLLGVISSIAYIAFNLLRWVGYGLRGSDRALRIMQRPISRVIPTAKPGPY